MSDIPRNPSFYHPTTHAKQQARYRGIDWPMIAETINEGDIKPSYKEDCCLFINEFWYADEPVGVVANFIDGRILTVEYRHE